MTSIEGLYNRVSMGAEEVKLFIPYSVLFDGRSNLSSSTVHFFYFQDRGNSLPVS